MDRRGGRDDDPVDAGLQNSLGTVGDLDTQALDRGVDGGRNRVVHDQRVDGGQAAQGGGVERSDTTEADQAETHMSSVGWGGDVLAVCCR